MYIQSLFFQSYIHSFMFLIFVLLISFFVGLVSYIFNDAVQVYPSLPKREIFENKFNTIKKDFIFSSWRYNLRWIYVCVYSTSSHIPGNGVQMLISPLGHRIQVGVEMKMSELFQHLHIPISILKLEEKTK